MIFDLIEYSQLIYAIILIASFTFLYFKFKRKNKNYIDKIELLKEEIIKNKERTHIKKIKSYHSFFKTVRHIFTHFKPETISVYLYNNKPELNTTIMKFLYQIKNDGSDGDGTIIFTGKYNNIPITNIYAVSKIYYNNNVLSITNIDEISQYDKGLYTFLRKSNVTSLYLINIYSKNSKKPIGFFTLTYKDNILSEQDKSILLDETNKISNPLYDIIN